MTFTDQPNFIGSEYNNRRSGYTPDLVGSNSGDPWSDLESTINQAGEIQYKVDVMREVAPKFWQANEDLLFQIAQEDIDIIDLANGVSVIEQYTTTDQVRTAIERLAPSDQRVVFDQLTTSEQKALVQSGYDLEAADHAGKNWFMKGLGAVGDFVGGVPVVGKGLTWAGGNVLKGLEFAGETVNRGYRTLAQFDGWKAALYWTAAAATAVASVALAGPTFGSSLAGLGAAATFATLAGLAGGNIAAMTGETVIAAVTGNENQYVENWRRAADGEKLFNPAAIAQAKELLNHSDIYYLADSIGQNVDPYELAAYFAGVRNADQQSVQLMQTQAYAEQFYERNTREYHQLAVEVDNLLQAPEFQQAVRLLQQGKYSPGRGLANGLFLTPGTRAYGFVSGLGDATWRWFADPANLVAPAVSYSRFRRLGVESGRTFSKERFVHVAQTNRQVRRAHTDFVNAAVAGRYTDVVPNLRQVYQPFRDWAVAKGYMSKTYQPLKELDNSHVIEFFGEEINSHLLREGIGLKRGAHGMLMFAPQRNVGVRAAIRNNLLGFRNAFTDPVSMRNINNVLAESGEELVSFNPENIEGLLLDGRLLDISEEATTGLIGLPGEIVGRKFAWINRATGGTLGKLMDSVSIMANRGAVNLVTGEGIDRAVNSIGSVMGLPKSFTNTWLNQIMSTGDVAARARILRAFYDTLFDATGFTSSKAGRQVYDEFDRLFTGYGLGRIDQARSVTNSTKTVPRGVLGLDQAIDFVVPDISEVIRAQRIAALGDHLMLADGAKILEQNAMKYWRPLVLLRGAYIPRNGGEELLAFFSRVANLELVASYGARKVQNYNEYLRVVQKAEKATKYGLAPALTSAERAILKKGGRGFVNNQIHKWEAIGGSVVGSTLDTMERWVRGVFEHGISPELAQRGAGLVGKSRLGKLSVKNELATTLLAGKENSWRRVAARGVNARLMYGAQQYVHRNSRAIMEALSANNRSMFAPEIGQSTVGLTVYENGEAMATPLVQVGNEFERFTVQDELMYGFAAHDELQRVLVRDTTMSQVLTDSIPRYFPSNPDWDKGLWTQVVRSVTADTPLSNRVFVHMNYAQDDSVRVLIDGLRLDGENIHPVYSAYADVLDEWFRQVHYSSGGAVVTDITDLPPQLEQQLRNAVIDAQNRKIGGVNWLAEEAKLYENIRLSNQIRAAMDAGTLSQDDFMHLLVSHRAQSAYLTAYNRPYFGNDIIDYIDANPWNQAPLAGPLNPLNVGVNPRSGLEMPQVAPRVVYRATPNINTGLTFGAAVEPAIRVENGNLIMTLQPQDHWNDPYRAISTSLSKTQTFSYAGIPITVGRNAQLGGLEGIVYELDFDALASQFNNAPTWDDLIDQAPAPYYTTGNIPDGVSVADKSALGTDDIIVRMTRGNGSGREHEIAFGSTNVIEVVMPPGTWRRLPDSELTIDNPLSDPFFNAALDSQGSLRRMLADFDLTLEEMQDLLGPTGNLELDFFENFFNAQTEERITMLRSALTNRLDEIASKFHTTNVTPYSANFYDALERRNPILARYLQGTPENGGPFEIFDDLVDEYENYVTTLKGANQSTEEIVDVLFNDIWDAFEETYGKEAWRIFASQTTPQTFGGGARVKYSPSGSSKNYGVINRTSGPTNNAELKELVRLQFQKEATNLTSEIREGFNGGGGFLMGRNDSHYTFVDWVVGNLKHQEFDYLNEILLDPKFHRLIDDLQVEQFDTKMEDWLTDTLTGSDTDALRAAYTISVFGEDMPTVAAGPYRQASIAQVQNVLGDRPALYTTGYQSPVTSIPFVDGGNLSGQQGIYNQRYLAGLIAEHTFGDKVIGSFGTMGWLDPSSISRAERGVYGYLPRETGRVHAGYDDAARENLVDAVFADYYAPYNVDQINRSEFMVETLNGYHVADSYNPYQKRLFTVSLVEPKYLAKEWEASRQLFPNVEDHFDEIVDNVVTKLFGNYEAHKSTGFLLDASNIDDLRQVVTEYVGDIFRRFDAGQLYNMPGNWFVPTIGLTDPRTALFVQDVLSRSVLDEGKVASIYSTVIPRWAGTGNQTEVAIAGNVIRSNKPTTVGQTFYFDTPSVDSWQNLTGPVYPQGNGAVLGVSRPRATLEYAQQGVERVEQVIMKGTDTRYRPRYQVAPSGGYGPLTPDELEELKVFRKNTLTGELEEVPPDSEFQFTDKLFDRNGDPINLGDPQFFAEEVVSKPKEIQWQTVGPVLLDNFDDLTNSQLIGSVDARVMGQNEVFSSSDSSLTRYTFSRQGDIYNVDPVDRPGVVIGRRLTEVVNDKNLIERMISKTFSEIFGPAIDSLSRTPQAMHGFVTALPVRLSIADSFMDVRMSTIASRNIRYGTSATSNKAKDFLTEAFSNLEHQSVFVLDELFDAVPDVYLLQLKQGQLSAEDITRILRNKTLDGTPAYQIVNDVDFAIDGTLEDMQELGEILVSARNHIGRQKDIASEEAIASVIPYIDDPRERTIFANKVNTLMPFHYAESNFYRRWVKIFGESDDFLLRDIHQAQLIFNGFREAGIITEDPNGDYWIAIPGSGLVHRAVGTFLGLFGMDQTDVNLMGKSRLDNLLPGFNSRVGEPQFGPLGAFPMALASNIFPELQPLRRNLMGDLGATRRLHETVLPPVLAKLVNSVYGLVDPEHMSIGLTSNFNNFAQYAVADGSFPGEGSTAKDREDFMNEARNAARIALFANFFINTVFPVPGTVDLSVAGQKDDDGILSSISQVDIKDVFTQQFRDYVSTFGYDEGIYRYVRDNPTATEYGIINPLAFLVAGTERQVTGPIVATEQAWEFYTNNDALLTEYPDGVSWFVPNQGYNNDIETSAYVWNQIMRNGLRERIDSDEFYEALIFKTDAYEYYDMLDRHEKELLAAIGRDNKQAGLVLEHQQEIKDFKITHPLFTEMLEQSNGRTSRQRTITDIRELVNMTDPIESEYFGAIYSLSKEFDIYEFSRSRITGNSSRSAQERQALDDRFEAFGEEWALMNPDIEMLWKSIYKPESSIR